MNIQSFSLRSKNVVDTRKQKDNDRKKDVSFTAESLSIPSNPYPTLPIAFINKPKLPAITPVQTLNDDLEHNKAILTSSKLVKPGFIKRNPLEKEIMNLLLDPKVKSAFVSAHKRPDVDAFGSSLGISALFEKRGVKVNHYIDDRLPTSFAKMPSAKENVFATNYIVKKNRGLPHKYDLSVVTDTSIPDMVTPKIIQELVKASSIIIIDHHKDSIDGPTNKEQWITSLKEAGASESNIIYWKEERESASEMIAELDSHIDQESKISKIDNYDPEYYKGYRLALASGIVGDTGGLYTQKGNVDNIKLARLSSKKVQAENGKFESITRNMFNWLVNHSGVDKEKIDIQEMTRISLPKKVEKKMDDLLSGKDTENVCIDVKTASKDSPIAYYIINDRSIFKEMADEANVNNKNSELKLKASDLYQEFKKRAEEKIVLDKNIGLMMIVSANIDDKRFGAAIRSYGDNGSKGEVHIKGHVNTEGLARKIVEALKETGSCKGGGHDNAVGCCFTKQGDFAKDYLPIINKVFQDYCQENDIYYKTSEELSAISISMKEKSKSA